MNSKKKKQIEKAILKLMRKNKLNDSLYNNVGGGKEFEKCFIYIEIINTSPALTYVFNSNQPILVGRSIEENEICIQDLEVSRSHCQFFVHEGYLYLQCFDVKNPVKIKRGFHKIYVDSGYSELIYHKDVIEIGQTLMQAYLIYGTDSVIN